jgi:hypothetical protein
MYEYFKNSYALSTHIVPTPATQAQVGLPNFEKASLSHKANRRNITLYITVV